MRTLDETVEQSCFLDIRDNPYNAILDTRFGSTVLAQLLVNVIPAGGLSLALALVNLSGHSTWTSPTKGKIICELSGVRCMRTLADCLAPDLC